MKKKLFLLIAACMAMGQNAFAYDFSAVSPSGHTLYYKIVPEAVWDVVTDDIPTLKPQLLALREKIG